MIKSTVPWGLSALQKKNIYKKRHTRHNKCIKYQRPENIHRHPLLVGHKFSNYKVAEKKMKNGMERFDDGVDNDWCQIFWVLFSSSFLLMFLIAVYPCHWFVSNDPTRWSHSKDRWGLSKKNKTNKKPYLIWSALFFEVIWGQSHIKLIFNFPLSSH